VKVSIYNSQKNLKVSAPSVKKVVAALLDFYHAPCDEIAVHFITNRAMCKLHAQFFNDPAPTDCISFPYGKDGSGHFFLGEVFVCPATAHTYVQNHGGEVYLETTLYLTHGILHLLGYDDIKEKDRKLMKLEEARAMSHLNQIHLSLHP
jgi:probable rRNA maturation factor